MQKRWLRSDKESDGNNGGGRLTAQVALSGLSATSQDESIVPE